VGLGIDAAFEPLAAGLAGVRESRAGRAKRIAAELSRVGIDGSLEGAARHAGNPALISRTHFARFLVERNYACDVRQVFHRFLGRGKPGFVEHEWARLEDALAWIHGSGGVAVVAHPGRYGLSEAELERLLREFMDRGGEAIEVLTSSHTQDQCIRFARLASRLGLAASRGSDYHGPGESRTRPGGLPRLYPGLTPVWQLL
jgi:predicted metal-dependent phosphoesterase TrpH